MRYSGTLFTKPLLVGLGIVVLIFFIINVSYDIEKKREAEKRREHRAHLKRQNLDNLLFHPRKVHHGRKVIGNLDWHSGDVIPVFFRKNVKELKMNCDPLFRGSSVALSRAKHIHLRHPRRSISPSKYDILTKKCDRFKYYRNYITGPLTTKENNYPIAYSIIAKNSVFQFETLLRAIYRPQNFYCVHIDKNGSKEIRRAIQNIARCFQNVFAISLESSVTRGELSHLKAELGCLRSLLKHGKWKYFINLSENDFPLKINSDIVNILMSLKGANSIQGIPMDPQTEKGTGKLTKGIKPFTGEGDVIMNRETAQFAVNHPSAQSLLSWAEKTKYPQHTFYATLNYNTQYKIKGSYRGPTDLPHLSNQAHIAKFVDAKNSSGHACHGSRSAQGYCTFGVGDLPYLVNRKELFAYRFRWDTDRLVLQCLEQMIYQRSKEQFMYPKDYDLSFYKHLDIVLHQI
ncbi:beta-1,3-galactosyl-O-glycosyl-glycoprotein beta-1,6-N-acetylglucosaminyltransferase-like [Saccostrea echinata]|uniref:beta-1,3-galactosyl-O-glycosyl-glycoprotein beta-1,6-N-acetylglucosaminyltransferase-like n=1 Tax=Saccostrea echinata TaxID=191078 RepID=UPI002A82976A|nr:beta-1,3-galactosyl-O-glycosyl-glycoprotein beta-1,6-N-acetylglucosaminyltransferase-like [Saccostrea echinata]